MADDNDAGTVVATPVVKGVPKAERPPQPGPGWHWIDASTTGKKGALKDVKIAYGFWYNTGENLNEATERFGDTIVHDNFRYGLVQKAGALARRLLQGGKSKDEVTKHMDGWKPTLTEERGFRGVNTNVVVKFIKDHGDTFTAEERDQALEAMAASFPGGVDALLEAYAARRAANGESPPPAPAVAPAKRGRLVG